MAAKKAPTTDAAEILYRRYIEGRPEAEALLEIERSNAEIAQKVYELRTAAGLTQKALAARVGTSPSVISRLEDADYEGHSLSMLRRIAQALGQRLELRFVPVVPGRGETAKTGRAAGASGAPEARRRVKAPGTENGSGTE